MDTIPHTKKSFITHKLHRLEFEAATLKFSSHGRCINDLNDLK